MTVLVLHRPSHSVKRHLGRTEVQRNVSIVLNGHVVDTYTEGSQSSHFARGSEFDTLISDRAALFAKVLGCGIAYAHMQE